MPLLLGGLAVFGAVYAVIAAGPPAGVFIGASGPGKTSGDVLIGTSSTSV